MAAITITCTENDGSKIHAEATGSASDKVTWTLEVTPDGGLPADRPPTTQGDDGAGHFWADWSPVPTIDPTPDTYRVYVSSAFGSDSQPVPFGTCQGKGKQGGYPARS